MKTPRTLGPRCSICGGPSAASARSRATESEKRRTVYLAYAWACLTCGNTWEDDELAHANRSAMARAVPPAHAVPPG